jgi:hypothetical protein
MYRTVNTVCLLLALLSTAVTFAASPESDSIEEQFVKLLFQPSGEFQNSLADIDKHWQAEFTPMAIEVMSLAPGAVGFHIVALLEKHTGQAFGFDANQWFVWWWQQNRPASAEYARFKSLLYGLIDPHFITYFSVDRKSRIRLDEVRWGGVAQDGIPPLREPAMLAAADASYLDDSNVVFGIAINGDARAYPKRILAWHEMFVDKIGGVDFAGVYCTLCGAVILYETLHEGTLHQLGTSGFLYRSNKLMYDKDTQSLWNTTWGEPVIGPLVERGIRLQRSYLVTTTWGEWKRRHPDTTVLSIATGHQRDYAEGAAYREYFATDELMFSVATSDNRLQNKDEVLALAFPAHSTDTMAISAAYLSENPIYANRLGELDFVVLTDTSGANRVYASKGLSMASYDRRDTAVDSEGTRWSVAEDSLSSDGGRKLERLPAHRAFWFGWFAAYPDTILIK